MSNVKCQQFKDILDAALESEGKIALPNVEPLEDSTKALLRITSARHYDHKAYRMRIRDFDPPIDRQTHEIAYYPKIFTDHGGMRGGFMGSGLILVGGGGVPKAYTFFMCEHTWDQSGANHSRGWHPSRCTKCGFDASIDSGD